MIDVETLVAGEQQRISQHLLNQIIQARAMELVELIYNEIQRSGYDGLLQAGIVMTGGSAQIARLDELAREMLGVPVRIGVPTGLSGLAESIDTPPYATAVGLLRWGARYGGGMGLLEGGMSGRNGRVSLYERVKNWLREFLP
jgi:cell division protein FtsA